jgi:(2Fe-2S) ferredoxin
MAKDLTKVSRIVFMCSGATCSKKGAEQNIVALRACIKDNALTEQVHTIKTLCTGQCETGPMMLVYPDGVWYKEMDVSRAENLVACHLLQDQLLANILYQEGDASRHPGEER